MRERFILFFLVGLIAQLTFAEEFILYQRNTGAIKKVIHKGSAVLTYDEDKDEYTFEIKKKKYTYPRDEYKKMLKRHMFEISSEDYAKLEEVVAKHAQVYRLQNPSERELLEDAFNLKDYALSQVEARTGDCNPDSPENKKDPSLSTILYAADDVNSDKVNEEIIENKLREEGFLPLGELVGLKVEIMTSNDNPLHGILGENGLGVTNYGKGIEGDDRGKTFGIGSQVALDFTEGEISLRQYSNGYGRKAPQAEIIKIGDQTYTTNWKSSDANGRLYQEFLSIDGLELEVVKSFPGKNVFVKLIGRREVLDDEGGLAQTIQKNWHKSTGSDNVQYNYVDHRDKDTRYSAEFGVGRNFNFVERNNYAITGSLEASRNISTDGNRDEYYRARGDIKAVYLSENSKNERFPSWEARFFLEGQAYDDDVVDHRYGIEITKRFSISENGYFYIKGGVSHDDDRYSRDYSAEEKKRNGRLDLQHYLGAGFEYRF